MDIKAKVEELAKKIMSDKALQKEFKENPGKALEDLLGVNLPEEQINQLVEGVKAKITVDQVKDVAGKLGGLLKKD